MTASGRVRNTFTKGSKGVLLKGAPSWSQAFADWLRGAPGQGSQNAVLSRSGKARFHDTAPCARALQLGSRRARLKKNRRLAFGTTKTVNLGYFAPHTDRSRLVIFPRVDRMPEGGGVQPVNNGRYAPATLLIAWA